MKNFDYLFPVFADAISGAFGGAIIGNWIGGSPVALLAAIGGAVIFLIYGTKAFNKKRDRKKDSVQF